MARSGTPAHLQLAEMALKRARKTVRGKMRKGVTDSVTGKVEERANKEDGSKSSGLGQAAVLFGVSRLASRSVPGAVLIGGGFLAKKWLDNRTNRRTHRLRADAEQSE